VAYQLIQLALGSYDLLLDGEIIGSVVRSGSHRGDATWTAELLEDGPMETRPTPFTQVEHTFETLEDVCAWLKGAEVTPLRRTA
jgi:hypothetical protein